MNVAEILHKLPLKVTKRIIHLSSYVIAILALSTPLPAPAQSKSVISNHVPWIDLDRPLEMIRQQHKNRDLVVVFTADWDAIGTLLHKWLKSEAVNGLLKQSNAIFLVANATAPSSPGNVEMKLHGTNAAPYSIGLFRSDGVSVFGKLDLSSETNLIRSMKAVIDHGSSN